MATKPVSRKPEQEAQAIAESQRSGSGVIINSRYMAEVTLPRGCRVEVDILGISKADMLTGNYETETTP